MPATTRSKIKQTHLEDFDSQAIEASASKAKTGAPSKSRKKEDAGDSTSKPSTTKKRQHSQSTPGATKRKRQNDKHSTEESSSPTKKQKQERSNDKPSPDSKPILINRSPVLHLWAACVSQALYSNLPWETHLSIGSAISTLCAISKGRAIGMIEPADTSTEAKAEKERKKRLTEAGADDEVHVMRFNIHLKDGEAMVQGKPKKANEALLRGKFGNDGDYDRVKEVMEEAIGTWKGKEADFDHKAFGMYEKFRPNVTSGQGGWGRKGELKLETIREAVEK